MRSIELPNALAARDRSRIDADFIPGLSYAAE